VSAEDSHVSVISASRSVESAFVIGCGVRVSAAADIDPGQWAGCRYPAVARQTGNESSAVRSGAVKGSFPGNWR